MAQVHRVRVTSRYPTFSPGSILHLSPAQADARRLHLEALGAGRFRVVTLTGFKKGEEFGIEGDLAKTWAMHFVKLDASAEPAEPPKSRDELILAAALTLDPENPKHFTASGAPKAAALADAAGFPVTAPERQAVAEKLRALAEAKPAAAAAEPPAEEPDAPEAPAVPEVNPSLVLETAAPQEA